MQDIYELLNFQFLKDFVEFPYKCAGVFSEPKLYFMVKSNFRSPVSDGDPIMNFILSVSAYNIHIIYKL